MNTTDSRFHIFLEVIFVTSTGISPTFTTFKSKMLSRANGRQICATFWCRGSICCLLIGCVKEHLIFLFPLSISVFFSCVSNLRLFLFYLCFIYVFLLQVKKITTCKRSIDRGSQCQSSQLGMFFIAKSACNCLLIKYHKIVSFLSFWEKLFYLV